MSNNGEYDVIVIGGGPSGMMAAGRAAERGLRVLLIEKNAVLGKKLSITGGGRCNITNAEFDTRALLRHYGDASDFLYSPFSQFGVQSTFDFFTERKLPLKVEARKRAFPETERASDVVRVMEAYIRSGKVTVLLGVAVQGFKTALGNITGVLTTQGTYTAQAYIVGSGGTSRSETGSTGEGFSWLSELGHTAYASNPNLVPLMVAEESLKKHSGTTLSDVAVRFGTTAQAFAVRGNVLLTHFGISGPTILNAAHKVKELLVHGPVPTSIDLFPNDDIGSLRTKLQTHLEAHSNKSLVNALREWFPKGVTDILLETTIESVQHTKSHSISREVRQGLALRMKQIPCTVTGTMGLDWAVVSDGGVDLVEVDTKTMRSKLHSNLYLVGDVLHINRPSGGYSLQLCWTTGWVAGNSVCR